MCGLTFELSWHRRWDARPGLAKMYPVPPDRAWWPAVGAQLERGVRRHSGYVRGWFLFVDSLGEVNGYGFIRVFGYELA